MEKPKVTPELIQKFCRYASADAGTECCDGDFARLDAFLSNNAEAICAIINNDSVDQIHLLKKSSFECKHSENRPDNMTFEFKDIITITEFTTKMNGGAAGRCGKSSGTKCWVTEGYRGRICPICNEDAGLLTGSPDILLPS